MRLRGQKTRDDVSQLFSGTITGNPCSTQRPNESRRHDALSSTTFSRANGAGADRESRTSHRTSAGPRRLRGDFRAPVLVRVRSVARSQQCTPRVYGRTPHVRIVFVVITVYRCSVMGILVTSEVAARPRDTDRVRVGTHVHAARELSSGRNVSCACACRGSISRDTSDRAEHRSGTTASRRKYHYSRGGCTGRRTTPPPIRPRPTSLCAHGYYRYIYMYIRTRILVVLYLYTCARAAG